MAGHQQLQRNRRNVRTPKPSTSSTLQRDSCSGPMGLRPWSGHLLRHLALGQPPASGGRAVNDPSPERVRRAFEAMLKMGKIEVADIERAADATRPEADRDLAGPTRANPGRKVWLIG